MSNATNRIHEAFWTDRAPTRAPQPRLNGKITADLVIIGGGYTGLWTAILAKRRDRQRRVVVLEGNTIGFAASGRNGGFVEPSIGHGMGNVASRWPEQASDIVRISRENFREMEQDIRDLGIDCDWDESGALCFARTESQVADLEAGVDECLKYGEAAEFIPPARIHEVTKSPEYLAAMFQPEVATVDPYKLVRGLADAAMELGVDIFEHTVVRKLNDDEHGVRAISDIGEVAAEQAVLATNVYPALRKRLSLVTVPVYDYALMTEPLSDDDFEAIGWTGNEGCSDAGNRFHYYRKTDDGRILWGGYDAIYRYGSQRGERFTQREATFAQLERNFRETYPQLAHIGFTHQWGGMIDSSTQFCVTAGTLAKGRIAYAIGFTGLGVAATRFGANVMLDLLEGVTTERTELDMIRRKPLPFPPEPVRAIGIGLTQWSMAREDATGKRNVWLKTMDALGLGFDS
ncbi:NAD(P)/FAD-dependent oxidoreductase [Gulosibacter bifidus]|uniref:NAD(P)/FAD-dependent oxidoreductase n=1 Tax=Gulosibacter bifidus TaxID=272239 RepID=A0ABW5RGW7_9MICO|nr:FAD-dependent oxidoreductase [Gulosibacter bifidus]